MFLTVCSPFIPLKSESGGTTQGKCLIAPACPKVVVQISRGLHSVIGQGSSTQLYLVKKPNSTNRICACGYLVCLDFE